MPFKPEWPAPNWAPTAALLVMATAASPALADRCHANAQGRWTCSYHEVKHSFANNSGGACTGATKQRVVRWEVPEGTPPAGGWPVVFYYNGTVFFNSAATKPFTSTSTAFGANHAEAALHELLDDPAGSGRKYAVVAPEAPGSSFMQAWNTNVPGDYQRTEDHCFLNDLFSSIEAGKYGDASLFNMGQRYAIGISSGGYNTSRMAVSFNGDSVWKAFVIVSASYATCFGPVCNVPDSVPANHPPTKFFHGKADPIVPIGTMRPYHALLLKEGVPTEKVEHTKSHQFTADILGPNGAKAWLDRY
ncbi:MAG: poly(3-hydroxyoctanoate) depolymerase [Pseudomonadota bacterium]|jgi:pimeloyl-ACP methyl ester carboxylesterase